MGKKVYNTFARKRKYEILDLYLNKKLTATKIAETMRCSISPILRILHKEFIDTSNKGKPKPESHHKKVKINHWSKNKIIRNIVIKKINTIQKSEKLRKQKLGKKRLDVSLRNISKRGKKQTKRYMEFRSKQILPKKDTSIEIKIQNFLKSLGIDFFTHQYMKIEHGYQCDIFIPSLKIVIECDGDYWHKYPTGTDIDHIRTSELLQKGFKVLRLWEFEIKEMDLNKFQERLKNARKTP